MKLAFAVLQCLAEARTQEAQVDQFLSGADLALKFSVTRAAIWKAVQQLQELGTEVEALPRRGYRLALPSSPLDAESIKRLLPAQTLQHLHHGECLGQIESSNSQLMQRDAPPPGQFDFLTAEYQTAGRGRRGRSWLAPPGGALCLSWSWAFAQLPPQPGALSLGIGIAAIRALRSLGVHSAQLKWPNDLVTPQGKLGGILLEMRAEMAGPARVVIGIGLNVALPKLIVQQVQQLQRPETPALPTTDLASLNATPPQRAALAAALLHQGLEVVQQFEKEGMAPFVDEYLALDALNKRPVRVSAGNQTLEGIAMGINTDGSLKLKVADQWHSIASGDVSVRSFDS